LGLELTGGALGDFSTAIDDDDSPSQGVGFIEVLRGQQDGRSLSDEVADRIPHLDAIARVETRRGLVEEEQCRSRDEAGREIETAAHASGELGDGAVSRFRQLELLDQVVGDTVGSL
jgi:hypothetical protein